MSRLNVEEKPTEVGAFAAKTELSKLLRQTRAGKRFIITQRGKPVAELRPLEPEASKAKGQWGDMQGKIRVSEDFCAPLEEMREYMK